MEEEVEEILTEGVTALVTVMKILFEVTCCGMAHPNDDVMTTSIESLLDNPLL